MFKANLFVFLLVGMSFQTVYADDDINSALQQTQDCLIKQNCDSAKTAAGKAADQKALEAVGGNTANQQVLYSISADIMSALVKQAGGDPAKMQAIMLNAQTNPETFFNSLPSEIQAKIKSLAKTVAKNQAK